MIRSLLFRNLGLKILSLFFALVLWYSVVSERQSNLLVTVPLTFVNVPRTMKVRMVSDERVRLHLEGPISALRTMEIGKIRGTIDLSGAHEGKSRYDLLPRHFNLPDGIRIEGISPEVVYVVLERLRKFRLPVRVRLRGRVDPHYTVRDVKVIPKTVWVIGDQKARDSVSSIPTETIDITGLKKDFKKNVGLIVPRDVRLVNNGGQVEVRISLREKTWDKKVSGVKVEIGPSGGLYVYNVEPKEITVLVRGWATVIDVISPADVKAIVPTRGLKPGSHYVVPKIGVPQGIKVLSITPSKVKIVVEPRVRE